MTTEIPSASKDRLLRGLILLGWGVLAVVQASFTELLHDEAYHWHYGENLDWGYFHHPPMIALMTRIGTLLLPGELGVRLLVIAMSIGTLWLLERLCARKHVLLFFAIALSLAAVHAGSLIAAPDIPLLFFSTLFLYLLRGYLQRDNWGQAMLLGVVAAAILYSKYHGLFLLGLSLLANLRLLRRPSAWVLIGLAILLLLPHLYWHFLHDFPSYRFHYIERMEVDWDVSYIGFYFTGILAIGLPLMGPLLLWVSLRHKPTDAFERTLKVFLIGTLVCFFFLSFRGRMEANWMVSVLIPCMVLGHQQLLGWSPKALRWVYGLSGVSIALILFLRLYAMVDLFPGVRVLDQPIHHSKAWNAKIAELAQDRPVVFINEYRLASKYTYYTGKEAFSFNTIDCGGNQYDLWPMEHNAQGKSVLKVTGYSNWRGDSIMDVYGKWMYYQVLDSFTSFQEFRLNLDESSMAFTAGDTATLNMRLDGAPAMAYIPQAFRATLWFMIRTKGKPVVQGELMPANALLQQVPQWFPVRVPMPKEPGSYRMMFGFCNWAFPAQRNSKVYDIVVQ